MFHKLNNFWRLAACVQNWPRVLMDHLALSHADYICRLRRGSLFRIRGGTDDRHVVFEIFARNIYPVAIRQGDTVVDIGAQIGCFTVLAASQGARVFAFEPFPANAAALERNIALNRLAAVRAFRCAVGGERGERTMFVPDNQAHTGRYSLFSGRGSKTLTVSCVSLDDLVREQGIDRIDVLKIDCQGSEYEILYGASVETLQRTRQIVAECEVFDRPGWSVSALGAYLRDHGFQVTARERLLYAERDTVPA